MSTNKIFNIIGLDKIKSVYSGIRAPQLPKTNSTSPVRSSEDDMVECDFENFDKKAGGNKTYDLEALQAEKDNLTSQKAEYTNKLAEINAGTSDVIAEAKKCNG